MKYKLCLPQDQMEALYKILDNQIVYYSSSTCDGYTEAMFELEDDISYPSLLPFIERGSLEPQLEAFFKTATPVPYHVEYISIFASSPTRLIKEDKK